MTLDTGKEMQQVEQPVMPNSSSDRAVTTDCHTVYALCLERFATDEVDEFSKTLEKFCCL